MRTTKHSGRFKRSTAKHNDRRFDLDENPYIDQSRTDGNRYWTWCDGLQGSTSFEDAELKFYQENFKDLIEDRNERAVKQSHPERKTSASKLIHSMKTMPEEEIFEIGNKDNHVTPDELWDVFRDYFNWHNREFGSHIKILDVALHTDQATPNIHMRKVWMYDNEKGFKAIGQNKALQQLGYNGDLPDPDQKIGRYNNFKMFYSEKCRDQWLCICRRHGIDVERIPEKRPVNEQNLTRQQYIMRDQDRIIEEHEEEEKQLEGKISESQDELEGAKSEKLAIDNSIDFMVKDVDFALQVDKMSPKEREAYDGFTPAGKADLLRQIYHDGASKKVQLDKDISKLELRKQDLETVVIPQNQQKAEKIISDANTEAQKIKSNANDQAEEIVSDAKDQARTIKSKAETETKQLEEELPGLRTEKKTLEDDKKMLEGDIQGLEQRKENLGTEIQGKLDKAESEASETRQEAFKQADKIIGEAYQVKYHTVHYPNVAAAYQAMDRGEVNRNDIYMIYPDHSERYPVFTGKNSRSGTWYAEQEVFNDVDSGKAIIYADVPEDRVVVPKTVCKEIVGCLDRMPSLPASVKTFTEEFKTSDPDRNRDNSWSEPEGHGAR